MDSRKLNKLVKIIFSFNGHVIKLDLSKIQQMISTMLIKDGPQLSVSAAAKEPY